MSLNSSFINKKTHFRPPRPIDEYPEESIKKRAVLFTDIIDSTKFFKAYGNRAGRRMLRQHQEIASPAVEELGGVVVKMLGDSLMAYFDHADAALHSGIKIQKGFQSYNQGREPKDQIHIRISIHFGDVIVEEEDIFGDVVNVAAKCLHFVGGEQIAISEELFDQVQDIDGIQFKAVNIHGRKDFPLGVTLYRVIWDEIAKVGSVMNILLYLKPQWKLAKKNFTKKWDRMLGEKERLWAGRVERKYILSDSTVILVLKEITVAIDLAREVIDFLRAGAGSSPLLPIQIAIDAVHYLKTDQLTLEDSNIQWEEIEPGEIFVSPPVNDVLNKGCDFLETESSLQEQARPFCKITDNDRGQVSHLFLYQSVLMQGEKPPCFYCGAENHEVKNCPSKQLFQISNLFNKLGYISFERINKLFFKYLTGTVPYSDLATTGGNGINQSNQWAHLGFYELKKVFQLRFFRKVWNIREESWDSVRVMKDKGNKGGQVWKALDCIRVSDLEQAESVLKNALEEGPRDYRAHSAFGFLCVEKGNNRGAENHFVEALHCAATPSQKIYISLLLSRIYFLSDTPERGEEIVRKIIRNNPSCPEALYQEILFNFRKGEGFKALKKLNRLIERDRDYYIQAFIDPDLADFGQMIHPLLKRQFHKTKVEADETIQRAEKELAKLNKIMGEKDIELRRVRSLWSRIEELLPSDSYFGYLDMIDYGNSIIDIGSKGSEERRKKVDVFLNESKPRIREYRIFINNFPLPSFTKSVDRRLESIRKRIDEHRDGIQSTRPESLGETHKQVEILSIELDQINVKLKRLKILQGWVVFLARFFKKGLIYQSVNVLIALLLFPITAHYFGFLLPQFKVTPPNIWTVQKGILMLGGLSGLLLSIFMAIRAQIKR